MVAHPRDAATFTKRPAFSRVVSALPGLVWTAPSDGNVDFLDLRIKRAMEMLLRGDRKIFEIAMALGFFDQSHFSRTFRHITGVSPGEYGRVCGVVRNFPWTGQIVSHDLVDYVAAL